MWEKSHTAIATSIEPSQIWKIWSDLSLRPQWDNDTEWARIQGSFEENAIFYMKIKGGPKLKMTITNCVPNQTFTDTYFFPFARLDGIHHMEKVGSELQITTTMKIAGPLEWIWRKLVVEKIVATLPHQTDSLIQLAKKMR